ncbi:NAD(P)H-hydrate dehydratase [Teredinibacter turnerae]|uniref:NAD(P)H-hydrate dehydratase n=1 Tax=Teredinibacter turnerae TaxID=2426 RepID=UPI00035D2B6F|nr:NAD(P)H-hydrate dehydratase [Teredinibacter turnerae]
MAKNNLPTSLYTAAQVRQLDNLAIEQGGIPGIQLMKRAGRAAFDYLLARWPECSSLIVFCGGGNNGGDGYVIAALAAQRQLNVVVVAVTEPASLVGDAMRAYQYALQEGVAIKPITELAALEPDASTVFVDALLGTGIHGAVLEPFSQVVEYINQQAQPTLAVDVPSGICSDSGRVLGCAVKADATITFIGVKQGLLTGRAPAFVGELIFDDLATENIESDDYQSARALLKASALRIDGAQMQGRLGARELDAHKGLFGHVMVIGGDSGFGGAVVMAAEMAARSGAGLTSVATRPEHVGPVLTRLPELMVSGVSSGQSLEPLLARPSVLVVGPGLGRSPWSEQMLQQAAKKDLPMVVDADALNIIAEGRVLPSPWRENWILTPHPGEAARLLDTDIATVQADRFKAARKLQLNFGGVVILKGAGTVIAADDSVYLANVGNPGMATGGMGDVLAGLLGGLLAQGVAPLEAAMIAVCAHGDAADLAVADAGMRGLLATDLIPYIRELLN